MVNVVPCKIKCKKCEKIFTGNKIFGGIILTTSYSPDRCPVCNSKDVDELSLFGYIKDFFKGKI